MIRALKSSWWVHLPGLLAVVLMIALMISRRPWPARVPVHFDGHWKPDRWGSPWECAVFPILAIIITFAGTFSSLIWAGEENGRKRFNLTVPIISAPLGAIVGVHCWFWWNLDALVRTGRAPGGWWWVAICAAIICCDTVVLEIFRKAIPDEDGLNHPDKSAAEIDAERELQTHMPRDGRWTYFSSQRSGSIRWIIGAIGIVIIAVGASLLQSRLPRFAGINLICVGTLLIVLGIVMGSLNVQVNAGHLIVRIGMLGIRVLRLKLSDIAEIRVETFRPLADFGGWGIRRAGNTWAYILSGNRGVRVQTVVGKEYVIGSAEPEKLAAAIRAGTGQNSAPVNQ